MITKQRSTAAVFCMTVFCGACSPQADTESISETGFHENIPGTFQYFMEDNRPCSSVRQGDGAKCFMDYDDLGRVLGLSCPDQEINASFVYDDATTSVTEQWTAPDFDFMKVRSYEINGLFVDFVDIESTLDGMDPTSFRQTYIRDDQYRVVQIDLSGSLVGSEIFTYDSSSDLLVGVESNYQSEGETWVGTESLVWDQQDQLITKTSTRGKVGDVPVSTVRTMTYDDLGRLASQSMSVDNGVPEVDSFIYECDATPTPTPTSSYFEPCTKGPDSCAAPYECITTAPNHPNEVAQDVCLLPCDVTTVCGTLSTCLCKGLPNGGQTDGPVPDGFCECG